METKEIKINVPTGYEIDKEKSTFDNIFFKKKDSEKESLFLELIHGLRIVTNIDNYPESVFYLIGDNCVLEQKETNLFISYKLFWNKFSRFGMNYDETKSFIKIMIEKHLKWRGLSPELLETNDLRRWHGFLKLNNLPTSDVPFY
jgi:hypothetical protein